MSVIAVAGIPVKFTIKHMIKLLAKTVNGPLEALNFSGKGQTKTLYLRLSEKSDPAAVVERINARTYGMHQFRASIPTNVPKLAVAKKPFQHPSRAHKMMKLPPTYSTEEATNIMHDELLREMQSKYTELVDLDKKTDGQLLKELSKLILQRCKTLNTYTNSTDCFKLTRDYRKKFPHDGDFALIESILKRLGKLTEPLTNSMLMSKPTDVFSVGNVPYQKISAVCIKYGEQIIKQIQTHIENLSTIPEEGQDAATEAARIKVRKHLKNMKPYVQEIVKTVIKENVFPENKTFAALRVYGEPRLPGKDQMRPVLARMRGYGRRSYRMFNMLTVKVPRDVAPKMFALDNTEIDNCKLIVRPLRHEQVNGIFMDSGEAEAEADMMDEDEADEEEQ